MKKINIKDEFEIFSTLKNLYSCYSYKQYKMRKFEEYSLYLNNQNFLTSENIITFNDLNGKLLALKPDVTLSIIKNSQATLEESERVFYRESVFRTDAKSREFKEIDQIGLEFLGKIDFVNTIEVLNLAVMSLDKISANFMMDISHMGIICALLDTLQLNSADYEMAMVCLKQKNVHEIVRLLEGASVGENKIKQLKSIVECNGNMQTAIQVLSDLGAKDFAKEEMRELELVANYFENTKFKDKIRIDFAIVNDYHYYNGIIFQGFIKGVPKQVLSGGRYDKLVIKLGKQIQALGFALYLSDISRYANKNVDNIIDVCIVYDEKSDINEVMLKAQEMVEANKKVKLTTKDCGECIQIIKV